MGFLHLQVARRQYITPKGKSPDLTTTVTYSWIHDKKVIIVSLPVYIYMQLGLHEKGRTNQYKMTTGSEREGSSLAVFVSVSGELFMFAM